MIRPRRAIALVLALSGAACSGAGDGPPRPVAIVGATVAASPAPMADAVIVIDTGHVAALGTRADTAIPKGATLMDGRGLWVVPDGDASLAVGEPASLAVLDGPPGAAATRVVRRFVHGREQR